MSELVDDLVARVARIEEVLGLSEPPAPPGPRMLTTTEVAERMGLSRSQVIRLCEAGRIRGVTRHGHWWLIPDPPERLPGPRMGRPPKERRQ